MKPEDIEEMLAELPEGSALRRLVLELLDGPPDKFPPAQGARVSERRRVSLVSSRSAQLKPHRW